MATRSVFQFCMIPRSSPPARALAARLPPRSRALPHACRSSRPSVDPTTSRRARSGGLEPRTTDRRIDRSGRCVIRRVLGALAALLTLGGIFAQSASAQQTPAQRSSGSWWVVTENDVYVRSAPSVDSAYPFFRLDRGNLVRVAEETAGWARVAVVGPTFTDAFGFVRDDRRLRVAADGRTAQVVSRADILAPNLSARFSPDSSWATIGRLEPGTTVAISETVRGQRETMHKIGLPASAEGWVNLTFLRRANAEELARLDPGLRDPEPGAAVRPTGDAAPPRGGSDVVRSAEATTMVIVDDADGDLEIDALEETVEVVTEPTRTEQRPVLVPEPPARPAPRAADQIARVTLADLEFAFSQLAKEDPESAEVGPLRQRYLEFAERIAALDSERAFARTRADQLEIKEEIQERLAEVRRLQARQGADLEVIRGRRVAVEARQPYVAVGRLNASTVYDGRRLPLLFRVQDPSGGQTIGYLEPGGGFELTSLLGQLVGIVGTRSYDESLRLNIISPTRIDVLTTAPGSITIRP